jgi:hypothetical protein
MNEFTARKLGEVLAFSRVGQDTFAKGREALVSEVLPHLDDLITGLKEHAEKILEIADQAGMSEVTTKKAEATGQKLEAMRDMYVGDEWDNAAELLEWSGFFEGAAVVHWELVAGAGEALNDTAIQDLAQSGITFHTSLLNSVSDSIRALGTKKAL